MFNCSTATFKDSCGCTVLDTPESKEMTEPIDWWAKLPAEVAGVSEDLNCCGA